MTAVIAFDVNETLLDLRALDSTFHELFGDAALRPQWFAQMLQLSFVGGLTPLARLKQAPLSVAALTNSVQSVAEAQLEHAGLRTFFDAVISADTVRKLKPSPEPYRAVAGHFGVPISDVRLVAAHAWDISGALAAGCRAALVKRPGVVASPIGRQPDITGHDIADVVDRIMIVDLG